MAIDTGVAQCAGVIIRAGTFSGNVVTSSSGKADVLGARVAVITFQGAFAVTFGVSTHIPGGALVVVVTGCVVRKVIAAGNGMTEIIGTDVSVVTRDLVLSGAGSVRTFISGGAGIAIVAGRKVRSMDASGNRITGVCGAEIQVIAFDG